MTENRAYHWVRTWSCKAFCQQWFVLQFGLVGLRQENARVAQEVRPARGNRSARLNEILFGS
jgi:hypothetical protein